MVNKKATNVRAEGVIYSIHYYTDQIELGNLLNCGAY